ncbi:ATP-binding protein [Streptomyces sp. NPDC052309]|uniref:ATP-binding protein n=1 Tax=Streptomyces sp. NPDC052309 TaxID=3155421 RepID=UPI0034313581
MNGKPFPAAASAAVSRDFAMHFTSTPRGARLARHLVSHRLHEWGHSWGTPANETVTLITAELTANAVTHGRVPGRDVHLRLSLVPGTITVEVSDTRTERQPHLDPAFGPDKESGRGLLLVDALASRWGVVPRHAAPGKVVWAEVDCPTTT